MVDTMPPKTLQEANSDSLPNSPLLVSLEEAIFALQQQVASLDEARYEALRSVRDATRLAGELGLQVLETRIRLCTLMEHEPLRAAEEVDGSAHQAVLRLAHIYFDDGGKYRLALYAHPDNAGAASGPEADPIWCSEVIYDSTRPEAHVKIAISEAVRKAYRAAVQRGYRVVWANGSEGSEVPALRTHEL